MNAQDVVDATDPRALSEEGELRLRILTELNALVHCEDDICLAQELVREKLPGPNSDSECDAAVGDCTRRHFSTRVALHPDRSRRRRLLFSEGFAQLRL